MIELMTVVAIVGILSTITVIAYKGYMRKARASEIPLMFGEFKAKEEAYHAEFGSYLAACPNPSGTPVGFDCNEGDYWPATLLGGGRQTSISTMPTRWQTLKIAPGHAGLYCQYEVVAGVAGSNAHLGTRGQSIYTDSSGNSITPQVNWYYVLGQCDWDGDSSVNAQYWQRGDLSELGRVNEQR
jgi:Tfp pilus assembly major pilin PilA